VDASSREYKEGIGALNSEDAFKTDRAEKHVGFVAEEASELVATKDRKGLRSMDIVAVVTKVV